MQTRLSLPAFADEAFPNAAEFHDASWCKREEYRGFTLSRGLMLTKLEVVIDVQEENKPERLTSIE